MGITSGTVATTPTTKPANTYTTTVSCDLDLQSLRDAVEALLVTVAGTGQGDARQVSIVPSVLTDVLSKVTGVQLVATWIGL